MDITTHGMSLFRLPGNIDETYGNKKKTVTKNKKKNYLKFHNLKSSNKIDKLQQLINK